MNSSPESKKIQHLSKIAYQKGLSWIAPDYTSTDDPLERLEILRQSLADKDYESLILAGSSMGSLVSILYSQNPEENIAGMFLLAPAVGIEEIGYPETNVENIRILHGWHDELIPAIYVIEYAKKYNTQLTLVNDKHRLHHSYDLMQTLFAHMLDEL